MGTKKANGYWTKERILAEALKYKTPSEFQRNSKGAYLRALRNNILKEVCSHMTIKTYWTDEMLHQEALKYTNRRDFRANNYVAYSLSSQRRILDKVCSHMEFLIKYWTDEMLHQEALKYLSRGDFQKMGMRSYTIAHKRGILDQICSHMEAIRTYWTDEMLHKEALKYSTRVDFQKESASAYTLSLNRGLLNKICTHMKGSKGSSRAERELLAIVKSIYPNAKKLKDRKVVIKGKPWIKGFEIDILVGDRGIEYDGDYHHSFEYMRTNGHKYLWPDEDIHNYHEIKDTHFLSKGIQILHIKEEDWNKDKDACIKRCLDFLASK